MFSVKSVWNFRGRKFKDGMGPVDIRVTVERKSFYISSGIRVSKDRFCAGTIAGIDPESVFLNETLQAIVGRIRQHVLKCIRGNRQITAKGLKGCVYNVTRHEERVEFIDWMQNEVQQLGLNDGTLKHYTLLNKRLLEFGKIQNWNDLTTSMIYDFDAWLKRLPHNSANPGRYKVSVNTVHNYHKCLKAMLSRAVRKGLLDNNPYNKLRGEFKTEEISRINYLTDAEMVAFMKIEPGGGILEIAKDLFIFQMYTGMSYIDTQEFDMGNYRKIDGRWQFVGNRVKTGVPFVSQLLQPAIDVLEKYGMRVPKISNQKYNIALKALGAMANIKTPLHSHAARHTFATWMLRNGVRIENVGKMLGQKSIHTTQRYAKVLAEDVYKDFDRVAKMMDVS